MNALIFLAPISAFDQALAEDPTVNRLEDTLTMWKDVMSNKVLQNVIKAGARLAEPGEFTKRAFLNGRIDLSQAEAVMDIITAKTELSMKSAMTQSQGRLSTEINNLRKEALDILALIEYAVDFTEDDSTVSDRRLKPFVVSPSVELYIFMIVSNLAKRRCNGRRLVSQAWLWSIALLSS